MVVCIFFFCWCLLMIFFINVVIWGIRVVYFWRIFWVLRYFKIGRWLVKLNVFSSLNFFFIRVFNLFVFLEFKMKLYLCLNILFMILLREVFCKCGWMSMWFVVLIFFWMVLSMRVNLLRCVFLWVVICLGVNKWLVVICFKLC